MCHAHYAVHYVMRIMRIMQNPCNLYNIPVINKNHNISISINPTDIKHISLESSRRVESNGGLFIKIQSLDCEIIGCSYCYAKIMWFDTAKTLNWYNSVNILATEMKHISLESSRQDELNGGLIIKIQLLDREIIDWKFKYFK